MSRKTLERRRLAKARWPQLFDLLGSYFSQDFEIIDGSLSGVLTAAANDGSAQDRQSIIAEWLDWNASEGATDDIRPFLSDGFGVEIFFSSAIEARHFMNRLYDELIVRSKAD